MSARREFCTLFDSNYLTRAIVLARSLASTAPAWHLTAFCFDDLAFDLLTRLELPNVTPVGLADLEAFDPELLAVKGSRSPVEYCWTATPSVIRYVLGTRPDVHEVTYVDADLRFFSDPEPVFDEMGDASVLITPHRFPPALASAADTTGIYNVQFMTFRDTEEGRTALEWWRERCLEWCYARVEDGKMGDQKYLDDWPVRFDGVHVVRHLGAGLAPWNVGQYRLASGPSVEGVPAVFFHYHGLRLQRSGRHVWRIALYPQSRMARRLFYDPYFADVAAALQDVRQLHPEYDGGFAADVPVSERARAMGAPARREAIRAISFGRWLAAAVLRRLLHRIVLREELDPFWRARATRLHASDIDLVLDVGANSGQYAQGIRDHGWTGPLVSFEPLGSAYAALEERSSADPDWTARRLALTDSAGEIELQVAGNSASSSLLPMARLHSEAAPHSAVIGTESVPAARLDDVIDEIALGRRRIWLKLDVQGGELDVLRGAVRTLDRVAVIDAELSLDVLYEGQPDLMEVVSWLRDHGFDLVALDEAFHHPGTGQLLQCDGVFVRRLRRY
jgi:FkbM family methyltransferase